MVIMMSARLGDVQGGFRSATRCGLPYPERDLYPKRPVGAVVVDSAKLDSTPRLEEQGAIWSA
jgi:hypothetical protein